MMIARMVLVTALVAAVASAAEPPAPTTQVDIKIRDTLWQTLPVEVEDVYVGPDGRAWFRQREPSGQTPAAEVPRTIEQVFASPAPVFRGAEPALFEPGGRVWFYLPVEGADQKALAGYDGKAWVHGKTEGPEQRVVGACPGREDGSAPFQANAWQDGHAFFAAMGGVHSYDGKEWRFQKMQFKAYLDDTLPELASYDVCLVPLPDRKTVIAYAPGTNTAYVWRDGRWTETPLASSVGRGTCRGVIAADESGAWTFWFDGGSGNTDLMDYWPVGAGRPADFAAQVRRLGDADFKVRAAATEEMAKGDVRLMRLAERAAAETRDPEVRSRLQQIVKAISGEVTQGQRLGDYTVKQLSLRRRDALGTGYVYAESVVDAKGRQCGPGVLVLRPGHKAAAIQDAAYVKEWNGANDRFGPMPVGDGRLVWLQGKRSDVPARLIDTEQDGRTVLEMPDTRFTHLAAVLPDGTVFAYIINPLNSRRVGVCRPNAPDERHMLKTDLTEVVLADVAPDGTIWAEFPQKGIHVFDGHLWRPCKGLEDVRWAQWIAAGCDGTVLLKWRGAAAFAGKGGAYTGRDLRTVIQDHSAEVAAAFRSTGAPAYGVTRYESIVADKAGNVWLLEGPRLGVLVKDRWLEPAAGDGIDVKKIKRIAAVGDASRIYLTYDEYDKDKKNSFFGEVKDGRLVFSPGPYCNMNNIPLAARDASGGLWVGADGCQQRLTEKGVAEVLRPAGDTLLCDKGGNLWLREAWSPSGWYPDRVEIWRDGRKQRSADLSNPRTHSMPIASDRAGSVWAWTEDGLYHLTADDPAAPAAFALRRTYFPDALHANLYRLEAGPPGFLAAFMSGAMRDSVSAVSYIGLIPIPKD
jgi:hypothetical protein